MLKISNDVAQTCWLARPYSLSWRLQLPSAFICREKKIKQLVLRIITAAAAAAGRLMLISCLCIVINLRRIIRRVLPSHSLITYMTYSFHLRSPRRPYIMMVICGIHRRGSETCRKFTWKCNLPTNCEKLQRSSHSLISFARSVEFRLCLLSANQETSNIV